MSKPKSLAKSQKLARKRKRKQEARRRRKRKQHGFPMERHDFGWDAPGGVKMSEVLEEFVEPFEQHIDLGNERAYRRLLTMGTLAWNAALAPEADGQEMVDDALRKSIPQDDPEALAMGRQIVDLLIERKKKYFAHFRRPIIDFVLTDVGGQYHLTVMSAMTG
jgi:hypothetical protein